MSPRTCPQVLGAVGALPDICTELEISYFLLRRLLGVRTEGDKRGAKVGGEGRGGAVRGLKGVDGSSACVILRYLYMDFCMLFLHRSKSWARTKC